MTTWYVHRRDDNIIASVHSEPIVGYAEEAIDDTSPEFPAWARPPKPIAIASPAQFRAELRAMGKLTAVKALIALQDEQTQDDFEYATEFRSNSPKLLALAAHPTIGMSEQDVFDALTRAAARDIGA